MSTYLKWLMILPLLLVFTPQTLGQSSLQIEIVGTWEPISVNPLMIQFFEDGILAASDASGALTGTYRFISEDVVEFEFSNGLSQVFEIAILGNILVAQQLGSNTVFQYQRVEEQRLPRESNSILFVRGNSVLGSTLYMISSNGEGEIQLSDDKTGFYVYPNWSSDGERIAFTYTNDSDQMNWNIAVMEMQSRTVRLLTEEGLNWAGSWNPFNNGILVWTDPPNEQLFEIPTETLYFDDGYHRMNPAWSPNGNYIVYSKAVRGYELWLFDVRTMTERQLTIGYANAFPGSAPWNSEGDQVVFSSVVDGDFEIYTIDTHTQETTQLTLNNSVDDVSPSWHPHQNQIIYSSSEDGDYELYIIDEDGTNRRQVTQNEVDDLYPSWRP